MVSTTHLTFNCSKSTIETQEKGVKYVLSYNKNTRTTTMPKLLCNFIEITLRHGLHSGALIVNSEHISQLFLVFLLLLSAIKC